MANLRPDNVIAPASGDAPTTSTPTPQAQAPSTVYYRLPQTLFGSPADPAYLRVVGGRVSRIDADTGMPQGGDWEVDEWDLELIARGTWVPFDPDNANDWAPLIGRDQFGPYVLTLLGSRCTLTPQMLYAQTALRTAVGRLGVNVNEVA